MHENPPTRPLAALELDGHLHLVVPVAIEIEGVLFAGAETVALVEAHRN